MVLEEIATRLEEYQLSIFSVGYGYFKLYDLTTTESYETMSIWQIVNLLDSWDNNAS